MQGSVHRVFPGCPGEDHGDLSTDWEPLKARVWSIRKALRSVAFTSCTLGGCESSSGTLWMGTIQTQSSESDTLKKMATFSSCAYRQRLTKPGGPAAATSLHSSRKFDNQTLQSTWPSVDTTWAVLCSNLCHQTHPPLSSSQPQTVCIGLETMALGYPSSPKSQSAAEGGSLGACWW